ncbi:hypothetical protein Nepgr_020935 [Nepenthes gracilis]|uniref:Uncharacterized protein n=1 Tax=Nepenthes gracilis TaxID=150966 RepID=A0AAD3XWK7_NEPGR|nr:hypothetical protein Nepgr_020935 [Nepenthes gracilis]
MRDFFVFAFLPGPGWCRNDRHTMDSMYSGYYCYVVKSARVCWAVVLSLYPHCPRNPLLPHLNFGRAKTVNGVATPVFLLSGIAMGQPRPPTAQGLVFVHEDTYIVTLYMIVDSGWFFSQASFWLENYKEKQITFEKVMKIE